jgi:RNA polymerase sigma factor (sigma-70 family)
MRPSNTDLVRACLAGEEAAWRTLILGYERLIYSIPMGYGMGRDEADDIFQAVCMALMESLPSVRDPERLGQWLVVTTRRMCWERWRRDRREQLLPGNDLSGKPEDNPEAVVGLYEETQAVLAALDLLPDRCQHLLRRLFLEPQPPAYRELAQELGMPQNSLGPTRMRCLKRLIELLESTPLQPHSFPS